MQLFIRRSLWRIVVGLLAGLAWAEPGRAVTPDYAPLSADMAAGTRYLVSAEVLHPTQFSLGFREVRHKQAKFDRMTPTKAVVELKEKNVPVVIGPGGVFYMTDGHHTIRALLESQQAAKHVYGTVIANWRDLPVDEFWRRMVASNYANLQDAAGHQRPAVELPATLRAMASDVYRGLAWAVMKRDGFAERKDVYFQEFRWADFFRPRVRWDDANDAEFARAVEEAVRLAQSPEAAGLPGYVGR